MKVGAIGPYKARHAAAITAVDSIAAAVAWASAARVAFEFVLGETNIIAVVGGDDPLVVHQNVALPLPFVLLLTADSNLARVADSIGVLEVA